MAEFSKEYLELTKELAGHNPDFSIVEEFKKLEEGYYIPFICEGFGFRAIANENGECWVLYSDGSKITFNGLIENYKNNIL